MIFPSLLFLLFPILSKQNKQKGAIYFLYQFHSPKACENAKLSLRVTWHANALGGIVGQSMQMRAARSLSLQKNNGSGGRELAI